MRRAIVLLGLHSRCGSVRVLRHTVGLQRVQLSRNASSFHGGHTRGTRGAAAEPVVAASRGADRLNAFSSHVRQRLAAMPRDSVRTVDDMTTDLPTAQRAGAAELDAAEAALLDVLAQDAVLGSASQAFALHPLLCVRTLECLGLPAFPSHRSGEYEAAERPALSRYGWLTRHPELTEVQTQRVFERVLVPLTPLLADARGSTNGRKHIHPQVEPVLPMAVAWWCFAPVQLETALPMDPWLQQLVAVYATTQHSTDEHRAPAGVRTQLLPLSALFPLAAEKCLAILDRCERAQPSQDDYTTDTNTGGGADKRTTIAQSSLCRLMAALCEMERSAVRDGRQHCTSSRESPNWPAPGSFVVADALFWATPLPLLAHAAVQMALCSTCEVAHPPASSATTPSVGPGLSESGAVTVRVGISNDDAFRRFLFRLTAVEQRCGCGPRTIYIEPTVTCTGARAPAAGATGDGESGNVLRWILPLSEFIQIRYEDRRANGSAAASHGASLESTVRLSFTGVRNVLEAVLDCLQARRRHSSAERPPPSAGADPSSAPWQETHFPLLAHKPRIHAVKRVCEMMLRHARRVLAASDAALGSPLAAGPAALDHSEGVDDTAAPRGKEAERLWFTDVPIDVQEAVLRRMCGACRAIVRTTMEEKRLSLELEGPEGAALSAGGATNEARSGDPGSTATPASAFSPPRSSGRQASVGDTLRNAAHRVLEPALGACYAAAADAATSTDIPALSALLATLPFSRMREAFDEEGAAGGTDPRRFCAALTGLPTDVEEGLREIWAALRRVDRDAGSEAAWQTAEQLLSHPLQQPPMAVVEGIRLMAVRQILFGGNRRAVRACGEPDEDIATALRTVERLQVATQCVWKSCGEHAALGHPRDLTASSATDELTDTVQAEATDASEVGVQARDTPLQTRLSLLAVSTVLAIYRDCVREHPVGTPRNAVASALSPSLQTTIRRVCCSLLEGSVKGDQADEWTMVGIAEYSAVDGGEQTQDADALVRFPSLSSAVADAAPPSLWELVEELQELSEAAQVSPPAPPLSCDEAVWQWMGSPVAVARKVQQLSNATRQSEETTAGAMPRTQLLLVPWSTLADSRQPLRLYDEGGQSARETERFDHILEKLISFATPAALPRMAVAVRFVSAAEEIAFFTPAVTFGSSPLTLAPGLRVVNEELAAAQRVASWVEKQLLDVHLGSNRQSAALSLPERDTQCDDPDEEDYDDGLD